MFIVSENNKIIAVYDAQNDSAIKKAHPEAKIFIAPDTCTARTGEDVRQFDAKGERKDDETCIIAGIIPCPDDKIVDGKKLRDKTLEEKYTDGTKTMPEGFKLNSAKDNIEPMTLEELKAAKLITDAEYKLRKNSVVISEIAQLESKQWRVIREITLGDTSAKSRLEKIESDIVIFRKKLV